MKKFESIRNLFGKKKQPSTYKQKSMSIGNEAYLLREIVPDDIKDLLAIERQVYSGELPWTRSAFLSELHSRSPHLYILIEKMEKTVGFIGCRLIDLEAHITNIAVSEDEQGQGIGTYLLNEALQFARENDCTKLSLEVRLSNKHAQSVYRKSGFVSSKITAGYYDDGEDALEMIREVADRAK